MKTLRFRDKEVTDVMVLLTPFPKVLVDLIMEYYEAGIIEGKFDRKTTLSLDLPLSVAVGGDNLAICEYGSNQVQILNSYDLSIQRVIGRDIGGLSPSLLYHPTGVTISGNELYISDYDNACVQIFNYESGIYSRMIGNPKSPPGSSDSSPRQLKGPCNTCILDDEVFIIETSNRISVYNRFNCSYKRCFGKEGVGDKGFKFGCVSSLCFTDGEFFVNDFGNHVIKVLNPSTGDLIKKIGEEVLLYPRGIAINGNYVYVSDTHRVIVFTLHNGEMINCWGSRGNDDGQFVYPTGITLSVDRSELIVADCHNRRVQWFR